MWSAIAGIVGVLVTVFKKLFGMDKPQTTEVDHVGEREDITTDSRDDLNDDLSKLDELRDDRAASQGSDHDREADDESGARR